MNWHKSLALGVMALITLTSVTTAVAQDIDVLWLKQDTPCNWGVATGPDASVYCVDAFGPFPGQGPTVAKLDSDGNLLTIWGGVEGSGTGEFASPGGITVDSQGRVYVADAGNQRIQRFNDIGSFDRMWGNDVLSGNGSEGVFEVCVAGQTCYAGVPSLSGFTWPHDLAIDPRDDSLVIADTVAARVVRLDTQTNQLTVLYDTCEFEGCGQILSVAVDDSGSLFLALDFNNVARYDYDPGLGRYVQTWLRNLGDGNPPTAHYLALDSLGNVYVTDEQNHRVRKFDPMGNPLMTFGWGVNTGAPEFEVCTDASGCYNGIAWEPSDPPNPGQFASPIGIGIDLYDNIYVGDFSLRLQKFGVVSPEDRILGLTAMVIALDLHHGISNSLDAKLENAFNALQDLNQHNDVAVINSMNAFINAVEAQRGKKINSTDADRLITAAQAIVDLLKG